jgi:translation initiation factor 5A
LKTKKMADQENEVEEFAEVGAGASKTFPMQCSALRKGGHVMIKGRPCKIVEMSTSKTGKHGHAKVHMVALDIFTGKKLEDICPSTHNMDVPNVVRKDLQLVDIDGDYLSLMDDAGDTRDDIKVPDDELGAEIKERFGNDEGLIVSVLSAMDEEMAVAVKHQTS